MSGIWTRYVARTDNHRRPGASGERPWAFWLGVALITGGVVLHLPMYFSAGEMDYMLAGMSLDGEMWVGMSLVVVGFILLWYGLVPRFWRHRPASDASHLEVKALDDSPLTRAHVKMMVALTLAIAIDTQKPFTFTFILPGVAEEYNLDSPRHPAPGQLTVALFPFVAIIGTVVGSLVWGYLGDRIGRRPALLMAGAMFVATTMCGAMPAYWQNLVACFFMGASAGGLLPIAYSLLTETIPVKPRGQVVVLVAGVGTALGFLLASWTANWFIDVFNWRVMWFFNLPTGLLVLLLSRFIPESPRFLLAHGRREEAHEVMSSFGISVTEKADEEPEPVEEPTEERPTMARPGFSSLVRRPYRLITTALFVYGLAWGLTNFGFLVWLPTHIVAEGVSAEHITDILAKAALFSIPGAVLVSILYRYWSSRGTLILAALLTGTSLGLFIAAENYVTHHSWVLTGLLVMLLVSLWAMISVLAPYAAEVYPTRVRAVGSGAVAGASKLGGVAALGLAVFAVAPSLGGAAILAAVPTVVAAVMLIAFGIETRGRRLEEISAAQVAEATAS